MVLALVVERSRYRSQSERGKNQARLHTSALYQLLSSDIDIAVKLLEKHTKLACLCRINQDLTRRWRGRCQLVHIQIGGGMV